MKRMLSLTVLTFAALLASPSQPAKADLMAAFQDLSAVRAYPNPWRVDQHSSLPMMFDRLPDGAMATLRIFTISGELVQTVTGSQNLQWDLRNQGGQNVASGVYLYLLTSNNQQKTGKVVVIR